MSKKPKKKRKIVEYHTFLNDDDGMTQRDYLLLISTSVFFLFIGVGLIVLLFGLPLDEMYLRLVDIVTPVIMTIVASIFTIEGVEKVTTEMKNRRESKDNLESNTETVESIHTIEHIEEYKEEVL